MPGSQRIIVVGGVAAGASAAAKARRTNESATITVYERGPFVSFANCGLPYYVSGEIAERDSLLVASPAMLSGRFGLDIKVNHEVMAVDAANRNVQVRDPDGNLFTDRYDRLILATGSSPIRPPLPGAGSPEVHTLTTVPDAEQIRQLLDSPQPPRRAVVIGSGPIGLELAEAFLARKMLVTVVDMLPQVLPALDPEMAAPVANALQSAGAELILGDAIAGFHQPRTGVALLRSGREIEFDIAILSIGVRPNLELARSAGLTIGRAGGVVVDSRMLTSDPNIFAAGDIVESTHLVTGQKMRMPLAAPANRQGRVAGANAAGGDLRFGGVLGTFVVRVPGVVAGKTGLSEREARQAGIDFLVNLSHSPDHATYYPGSTTMAVKLVFERVTGRLLGGQVTGPHGADKRLDVLATAIAAGMTVDDLADLDLAYAPPFSSARDPVVTAGMAAGNVVRGTVQTITSAQLLDSLGASDGAPSRLVDVRTAEEQAKGSIPGAMSVPLNEVRARLQELTSGDPNALTVVFCRSGQRSYVATRILTQSGMGNVRNLTGGYTSYLAELDARRHAGRD